MLLERLSQFETVHRVDAVEEPHDLTRLPALDVADHVPPELRSEGFDLGPRRLDPILAEVGIPQLDENSGFVFPHRFRDRDERHAARSASRTVGRPR